MSGPSPFRRGLTMAAFTLIIAACAAGPATTDPPGATNGPGATNAPGATQPPDATQRPTVTHQPASGRHACDLVTDAELEEVTGLDVAEKGPTGLAPVLDSQCDYEFAVDSVFNTASMTLAVKSPGGRSYYETYFEPFIGDGTGSLEAAIDGVGDKAARGDFGTIMAVKGDALIDVQWIGMGENADDEMPLRIAQLVLSKLP